jgi:hypothetical protein
MSSIIPYRLKDLGGRMSYEDIRFNSECPRENRKQCRKKGKNKGKIHLGQLKLLISEIMFLSKVSKPGDIVLYVGAAGGYHTRKTAEMFPDLFFELWDASTFDIKENDQIKIFNKYFEDTDADDYEDRVKNGENILFICDMRNRESGEIRDDVITDDMDKQLRWAQIIKPKYVFLKHRLPYGEGITKYMTGTIYLQAYSPLSTESRLLTKDYFTIKEYDNVENDEMFAYFNCKVRFKELNDHTWDEVMKKYKIRIIWDNYIAFHTLFMYLNNKNKKEPSDDDVAKLFNEIIKFHRDRYGDKYDVVYE